MTHFIDRRLNPKGKSLANRQRFLRRARQQIREAVQKSLKGEEGQSGKQAADSGEGEDDFEFTMTQDEVLDIFFEDLELPNLVRTTLTEVQSHNWKRAGFTTSGPPNLINLVRTMRNSFGRRLALR